MTDTASPAAHPAQSGPPKPAPPSRPAGSVEPEAAGNEISPVKPRKVAHRGKPAKPGTAASAAKPDRAPAPDKGAAQEDPPGPLRILVAEDEALIRLDMCEMLGEAGYAVVGQAVDGQQAVDLARDLKPDLVLMDVMMPVRDGISAAETIGEERIAPVVMLTAFSQKELVERARDAGVMAYIVKPFTAADLGPAIDIARSRWLELHALEAEIADLGERLETRKAVDRAKGVLMQQLKITEAEAFRWIQKTAMDRRLGMRQVADAVVTGLPGGATS